MASRLQAVQSHAQRGAQIDKVSEGFREVASPYLDSREAMAYLRLATISVLYYHIKENRLPFLRRGGRYLFDRRELDAWLRQSRGADLIVVASGRHSEVRLQPDSSSGQPDSLRRVAR